MAAAACATGGDGALYGSGDDGGDAAPLPGDDAGTTSDGTTGGGDDGRAPGGDAGGRDATSPMADSGGGGDASATGSDAGRTTDGGSGADAGSDGATLHDAATADATGDGSSTGNDSGDAVDTGATADSGEPADTGLLADSGGAVESGAPEDSGAPDASAPESGVADAGCGFPSFTGTLATYGLASQPGTETTAPATGSAAGITAGDLARSASLTPNAGSGSINSYNWPINTHAIDPGSYYTFTISPANGCPLTLSTLAVDLQSSGTGPSTVEVSTSVDGFATHQTLALGSGGSLSTNVALSVSGASGAVEVRLYGYGGSNARGTLRIANTMTVSGTLN